MREKMLDTDFTLIARRWIAKRIEEVRRHKQSSEKPYPLDRDLDRAVPGSARHIKGPPDTVLTRQIVMSRELYNKRSVE